MTMKHDDFKQQQFIFLDIESFVPQDHIARKLKDALDWSFIYDIVAPYYSDRGRKSVDPVVLFKLMVWNIVEGNHSFCKTCRQAETDIAL